MHQLIASKKEEIATICRRHRVERLEVFGQPLLPDLFFRRIDMREELQNLLVHKVDLIHMGTIDNPYRLTSIENDRELVYAE